MLLPVMVALTATFVQEPCEFKVVQQAGRPQIIGPAELGIQVVEQPGSPVAIVGANLTGTSVRLDGVNTSHTSQYAVDVQNISDRTLSDVAVHVTIQTGRHGSGGGGGASGDIAPGQIVRVTGSGSGSGQSVVPEKDAKTRVLVYVEGVKLGECVYKPAQILRAEDWR